MHGNRVWHRIGDLGYFDENGWLWFCGRKAERVVTKNKVYYTDCCEGVINQHKDVLRSALIRCVRDEEILPAIVVEPIKGKYPKNSDEKELLLNEIRALAASCPITEDIQYFFTHKAFPVDVRHNAKIDRLILANEYSD